MADERTLYAGDLTTDQIGRRITATVESGAKITDELVEVRYFAPGEPPANLGDSPTVWVRFKNICPARNPLSFNISDSAGFWLHHTDHVEVVR